jgi:hypothetical protein
MVERTTNEHVTCRPLRLHKDRVYARVSLRLRIPLCGSRVVLRLRVKTRWGVGLKTSAWALYYWDQHSGLM